LIKVLYDLYAYGANIQEESHVWIEINTQTEKNGDETTVRKDEISTRGDTGQVTRMTIILPSWPEIVHKTTGGLPPPITIR
jgi:hypothetical protein